MGRLPAGDRRQGNKKAFGEIDGRFIRFMDAPFLGYISVAVGNSVDFFKAITDPGTSSGKDGLPCKSSIPAA
jgi:hypothetical protein